MNFKYYDEKTWLNWIIFSQMQAHTRAWLVHTIICLSNSNIEASKQTPTSHHHTHRGHSLHQIPFTFSNFISSTIALDFIATKKCISFTLKSIKLQFHCYVRDDFIVWKLLLKCSFLRYEKFILETYWAEQILRFLVWQWMPLALDFRFVATHILYLSAMHFEHQFDLVRSSCLGIECNIRNC